MTIKRKILFVVLGLSLISLTAFCTGALWRMFNILEQVRESSKGFGEFAIATSSAFLEREAANKLMLKAGDRAKIIDERFRFVAANAAYFSNYAARLYNDEWRLPSAEEIPYTTSANKGVLTIQMRSVGGKNDYPFIKKEVQTLANITNAFLSAGGVIDTRVTTIYIGTESGFFFSYDRYSDDSLQEFDPRVRPWYLGAKETGGIFWTDPYLAASSQTLVLTCSSPFYGADGSLLGVVGIDMVIEELSDEITNIDAGEYGQAFIINTNGIIMASNALKKNKDGSYEEKSAFRECCSPEYNDIITKMTNGETGYGRVGIHGSDMLIAYAQIPATGWSVAIAKPVTEIMELAAENAAAIQSVMHETLKFVKYTIRRATFEFAMVFIFVVITIIYLAGRLSAKITEPITTLEQGLAGIARGELDTYIEIQTGDEIERLGGSVNRMAQELKKHISNLQSITAEKERIGVELDVAKQIQTSMLPCVFPPFSHRSEFDIYALMQPAKEVGGDFYDFFFVGDNTLAVVIADVSEKGVPAALFMVIAKTLIKNNAQAGMSPQEVFEIVNNRLCENNDAGMFVTAFMGYLDIKSGKFVYVNAGHAQQILLSDGRTSYIKAKPCFVLGGMEGMSFMQDEITLKKGDTLLLYTDGVTEALSRDKILFGESRLLETVASHSNRTVMEFILSIKHDIDLFTANAAQSDDITMLALRYNHTVKEDVADEFVIDARIENLYAVHDFVAKVLSAVNCAPELQNRIKVAVEEVFVNIASHAYKPETGEMVVIRMSINDVVTIEFEDCGNPYNPLEREDPDITSPVEERALGGLGIYLVKNIMDAMEYRREGNKNIMTLKKRLVGEGS